MLVLVGTLALVLEREGRKEREIGFYCIALYLYYLVLYCIALRRIVVYYIGQYCIVLLVFVVPRIVFYCIVCIALYCM